MDCSGYSPLRGGRVSFMRKMIQRFWMIDDHPPSNPGCFVIPSYALKDSSLPTRPTRAQIKLAFEWWKKFPNTCLISIFAPTRWSNLNPMGISGMSIYFRQLLYLYFSSPSLISLTCQLPALQIASGKQESEKYWVPNENFSFFNSLWNPLS